MKKNLLTVALVLVALAFSLVSCNQGNNLPDGFKKSETGLIYKYHNHGTGEVNPQEGDFVTLAMSYTDGDSVLFNSEKLGYPMKLPMTKATFKGDVYDALFTMKVGDSISIRCDADSVFTKLFRMPAVPPDMDSVKYIYFNIGLSNIQTAEQVEQEKEAEMKVMQEKEATLRNEYLAANYPDTKPIESGMYFILEKKGNGKNAEAGKKVKVHYTGKFLDGSVFDSSVERGEPIEFTLGQGQVIKGWDEGIGMMRVGDKAVLVIPSDLAYGPGGRGSIPPSATLVFDVELIDVN
ncbi:MAG: FKBP-type peptidyl-prolyl cis-trans isomerase [Bacteroidales bacterium]|jgi:FKBP-type peptidyl-prolyl cis-trans isomerase